MPIERIRFERLRELLDEPDTILLDVRSVEEFAEGHPEGAYNIPFAHRGPFGMIPNPDFVREVEAAFPKDARLVLTCRSGGRSAQAAQILHAAGYRALFDYAGGFAGSAEDPGWVRSGGRVATTPAPGRSYEDLKKARGE